MGAGPYSDLISAAAAEEKRKREKLEASVDNNRKRKAKKVNTTEKVKVLALTALVLSSHGSDYKKYVATWRQIRDALKEEKRSRYKQSTLRIKD